MSESKKIENEFSYDEIPYPSHPYGASHPDHLYTMAKLFGIDAVNPDEARILELGCASGGNITPAAELMPNAHFVGVDLSEKQINEGQETVAALGLKNIELKVADFNTIDESYGKFDYIISHGVFSWVPAEAQHKMLDICKSNLSDNGVAYISYNAYPGWFMRGMIRQMMLHHVKSIPEPIERVRQARALLKFIVEATEGQETPYVQFLKHELDLLAKHSDAYLFHDHLEENNIPMFFYEFVDMVKKHDLQFVSESSLASMITSNLPKKAAKALTELTTDLYHRSQYTDFVTNRMFRQSLIAKKELSIDRHITDNRLDGAYFAGDIKIEPAEAGGDLSPEVELTFRCSNGRGIQTKSPIIKALMISLVESWPRSLTIEEIQEEMEQRLSASVVVGDAPPAEASARAVRTHLMQMLVRGDIEFRYLQDRFTTEIAERPCVSALARRQAKSSDSITTLRHVIMKSDPLTRLVIQELDGTKDRTTIVDHLKKLSDDGKIKINVQGPKKADLKTILNATVEKVFVQLRRTGMLVK